MKKVILTVFLLLLGVALTNAQVTVKFQVNMGVQTYNGAFTPGSDSIFVSGSFQHAASGAQNSSDWTGLKMAPASAGDSIYALTVTLDDSVKGHDFEYKFVLNNSGWESISNNRTFTAPATTSGNLDIPVVYYNDDTTRVAPPSTPPVKNYIKFVADLSDIFGTGAGYFDPAKDSIQVNGLDWGTVSNYVSGNKVLHQNSFISTQYETDTIVVQGQVGDSASWKFKAFPDLDFVNSGWENLSNPPFPETNRWYHFVSDTSNLITLPTIKPVITPSQPPITRDVTLTFHVDMNGTITDAHNGYVIPYDSIQFVGLRSGLVGLGDWTSGFWTPADTLNNQLHMRVLHDDGLNGDATAGDKIWSDTVVIPSGTPGGSVSYKYGVYYGTMCDTANGGSNYMDNEAGFGVNHDFTLTSNDLTINDSYGVITAIERDNSAKTPATFKLSQNYPNPFNPSTIIQYNLPKTGLVSLKIYDILGREVATLVNEQQVAGVYKVTFDASKLASGVYIYRIISGNFVSTKKMMLLK